MTTFWAIVVAAITWWLVYEFIYSPKARVKRLWKEIFGYAEKIGEVRKKELHSVMGEYVSALEHREEKAGKLINAILEHEYQDSDDEDDKEYAAHNRWEKSK